MSPRTALTLLAWAVVWLGLTLPDRLPLLSPQVFLRLPLELFLLVGAALVLPPRPRRVLAVVAGVVVALVAVLKVLDMGFHEVLDRPFDPVIDWRYLGYGVGFVRDAAGGTAAVLTVVGAAVLVVALLVVMPLALTRVTGAAARHRRTTLGVVAAGAVCAVVGLATASSTARFAYAEVARIPSVIEDQRAFARAVTDDPLRDVPAEGQLTGLRGKDVLFVFVESYGRVAVQDAPGVRDLLRSGTSELAAAGFGARSGFLTSPTYGAGSWLAHSTLQSGLWVDSQQRYDVLMASRRLTLSQAFRTAGWRTVGDSPANTHDWPQGRFYHYDQLYDARNVGYAGPRFGYPTMPDQFTLSRLRELELAPRHRRPVMAEVDLISSHASWSRLPRLVPWSEVGDGSVYAGMPEQGDSKAEVWQDAEHVRSAYARSIEYSLASLIGYVETYGDDRLVLVLLGDHQPATVVSGEGGGHDVPITVVAHDPAVLDRISSWGWQDGLLPGPDAPVWRMDAFRDRFLAAFGPPAAAGGGG